MWGINNRYKGVFFIYFSKRVWCTLGFAAHGCTSMILFPRHHHIIIITTTTRCAMTTEPTMIRSSSVVFSSLGITAARGSFFFYNFFRFFAVHYLYVIAHYPRNNKNIHVHVAQKKKKNEKTDRLKANVCLILIFHRPGYTRGYLQYASPGDRVLYVYLFFYFFAWAHITSYFIPRSRRRHPRQTYHSSAELDRKRIVHNKGIS